MRKLFFGALFACLILPVIAIAQSSRPAVVFQTGFSDDLPQVTFNFTAGNKYLYGYNENGQYVIWDVKTNRQIKTINPPAVAEMPSLFYLNDPDFSKDERYMMIPDFPKGNYFLYDIVANNTIFTFVPPDNAEGECYTDARFSEDGNTILLVSQSPGNNSYSVLRLFNRKGNLLKTCKLALPHAFEKISPLVRMLMNKADKLTQKTMVLKLVAASPSLDKIYVVGVTSELYKVDFGRLADNTTLTEEQLDKCNIPGKPEISGLGLSGDKLIVQRESEYTDLPAKKLLKTDTLFIVDKETMRLQNKIVSRYVSYPVGKRSNCMTTSPLMVNASMNIYIDTRPLPGGKDEIIFKDISTGRELFTYQRGEPFFWYTKGEYQAGELNGGSIVAISDDHKIMAVCSREIIINDIENKRIKSYFPPVKGSMKLNQPVFLDSFRVLIPKIYNDAFVLDLKNGSVDRLKKTIDCEDTFRNGANIYYNDDRTAIIGVQNTALSLEDRKVAIASFVPNDLCLPGRNKNIEVWSSDKLEKLRSYSFSDREFTYNMNMIPGFDNKFLVNYKLVDFNANGDATVKLLVVVEKRDSFFAFNPVYIPSSKSIFAILGTRNKPGNPDLIFAHFTLDGKLIKSFRYERKKSKEEFQTYILESQLSPDGTRLLFGMHDGTAGIFDIAGMKMLRLFEHGIKIDLRTGIKKADIYHHISVYSACFIDNNHFVTCGNDAEILVWSVNDDKPLRTIHAAGNAYLLGINVSPDKRYLYGASVDKNIVFINLETGKTDFVFTAFNYESYAITSSEGYYMSNKKSNNDFSFLYNGRPYEFSQFDLSLNRPDKILEQIGYASAQNINYFRKAYEKRVQKLGYNPVTLAGLNKYTAPDIALSGLPEETITTAPDISFTVTASDANYPLDRLLISVNGVPLYGSKGMAVKKAVSGNLALPVKIPLSFGKNQIVVSVINKQGSESLRENIFITRKGVREKPDLHIISIGSGVFADKSKNLQYPSKDAGDVLNLFDEKAGEYGKINKYLLVNEKVTRGAVLKLKEQLKKTKPDDLVILFYAGHGILDNNLDYYLSAYTIDFLKPAGQGISYDELESILDSIPARNKVLLIDACHSGELDKDAVKEHFESKTQTGETVFRSGGRSVKETTAGLNNSFKLMQTLFSDLRRSSGSSVIAAAGGAEYAVESERWKNGVFTYCLQLGLKEKQADLNKDGKIQLSELLEFLQHKVSDLTNGNQQPTGRTENLVNDITIW